MLRMWLIAIAALASLLAALPVAAQDQAATIYAVSGRNRLVTFSADAPGTILNDVRVTGLDKGDRLVGIDVRPADGMVYGVGVDRGTGSVYRIDPATGQATLVAPISETLSGRSFGVDFNPVVDRLRVVSDARQNLRIVPDTGVASVDGMLSFNSYRTPNVVGAAYTNSFAGTTSTQLFNIESRLDLVTLQNPPNDGTLALIGFIGPDTERPGRVRHPHHARRGREPEQRCVRHDQHRWRHPAGDRGSGQRSNYRPGSGGHRCQSARDGGRQLDLQTSIP